MAEKTKQCTGCTQVKPLCEFGENRKAEDGRNSWCRACVSVAESVRPVPIQRVRVKQR